jgi:ribosomal protein S18 acetylase RimI-like enzyme
MEIRLAKESDIEDIKSLLLQIDLIHNDIRPDIFKRNALKYNNDDLIEIINNPLTPIFVYYDNNKVVGHCFTQIIEIKNNNVLQDVKTLYIDDLCVDKNNRGNHIGKKLYDYVINYAKSIKCYNVTLNVWAGNDKALSFYESIGLKPQKTYMEKIL